MYIEALIALDVTSLIKFVDGDYLGTARRSGLAHARRSLVGGKAT